MVEAKKYGNSKPDFMGKVWWHIHRDGKPLFHYFNGKRQPTLVKAISEVQAKEIYSKQQNELR